MTETVEEKQGIGGRDNFMLNLVAGDDHQGHWIDPLTIARCPEGIRFYHKEDSFTVDSLSFKALLEWLESWGYI